jgi:hypothetical protein
MASTPTKQEPHALNSDTVNERFEELASHETNQTFKQITSQDQEWARERERLATDPNSSTPSYGKQDQTDPGKLAQAAKNEMAPTWNTNMSQPASKGTGRALLRWFGKKAVKRWAIGGAITGIIGFFTFSGASFLLPAQLNSLFTDHAFRFMGKSYHTRMGEVRKARYFNNPDNCTGGGVRCRFYQGVSDNEVKTMERVGLGPQTERSSTGVTYIKEFHPTNMPEITSAVNASNFTDVYNSSPGFVQGLNSVAKSTSALTMGKATLNKAVKLGVNLHNPLGTDPADEQEAAREWRKTMYGDKSIIKATGIEDIDNSLREGAQQIHDDLAANNFDKAPLVTPPSLEDFTGRVGEAMTVANAGKLAGNLAKGSVGLIQGPFAVADTACTGYTFIRRTNILMKTVMHAKLIAYSMMFMTIGSKMKAGQAASAEVGLLMNFIMSPSVKAETAGLGFFQSAFYLSTTGQKFTNAAHLARFTSGGSVAGMLGKTRQIIDRVAGSAGINVRTSCAYIKGRWFQILAGVAGVALSVATLGTSAIIGLVGRESLETILQTSMLFFQPLLLALSAGIGAPDLTDPERGYGAGNALYAGMMAFSGEVGRANGMRPMKRGEYAKAIGAANEYERFAAQVESYGKGPFSPDNPNSVQNKVLMAIAPYVTSSSYTAQSGMLAVLNPFSLFSSASWQAFMSNPAFAADADPDGTELCQDEDVLALELAATSTCEILYWEDDQTTLNPQYKPEATLAWMISNNHIDPRTGATRSAEFRNFLADCRDDLTPLLEDGAGADPESNVNSAGGEINTKQCSATGERETYFRQYIKDTSILDADQQGAEGVFGKDHAS